MVTVGEAKQARIFQSMEVMGERYINEVLLADPENRPEKLLENWMNGAKFLIGRLYFQGRNDRTSMNYLKSTLNAFDSIFGSNAEEGWSRLQKYRQANALFGQVAFVSDKSLLWHSFSSDCGKARDREMILDVLRFISGLADSNVVAYSLQQIDRGMIRSHRDELKQLRQVGPKTSALYLRDLLFIFNQTISPEHELQLQPIDTWVGQVRAILDPMLPEPSARLSDEEWIVQAARTHGVNPAKVNSGAWMIGKYGFDMCLGMLLDTSDSPEKLRALEMPSMKRDVEFARSR